MRLEERLAVHIQEANIHIERLLGAVEGIEYLYPLDMEKAESMSTVEKDKLDVLAFRFSKLQDLLGTKIFREYLVVLQYPVEDKNYLELLRELDREKIIDIDLWSEFRAVRNSISHDYPYEENEKLSAINYLIKHVQYLIDITYSIKENFEIITKRD